MALDALEQALWARPGIDSLVHHSNRGVQYISTRYTERLAETVIGSCKTEVIRRRGPWRHLEATELATLEWVDWFNKRRRLEPSKYSPVGILTSVSLE